MNLLTTWNTNRKSVQLTLGLASLVTLLAYTFWHTGGLLARYIAPGALGYVAALGIELAIVSMSLRIGELGWRAPDAAPYKVTLILTLIVSALANVAEGHATKYGAELTRGALPALDPIQAIIGVSATALLSIVVYLLADIIGGDVQRAETRAATEPVTRANDAPAWTTRANMYAVGSVPGPRVDPPVPVPVAPRYPRACACGYIARNAQAYARHARDCEHARRDKKLSGAALRVLHGATGD